jgi:hypothetical protein
MDPCIEEKLFLLQQLAGHLGFGLDNVTDYRSIRR